MKCVDVLENEKKYYLSAIQKETGIPSFVIKQYLSEIFPEDYLVNKVSRFNNPYYTLHDTAGDGSRIYALFQLFNNKDKVPQQYVHSWIVCKILDIDNKEFDKQGLAAHHLDEDKLNNCIWNLIPIPQNLHMQLHRALEKDYSIDQWWFIQEYGTEEYLRLLVEYLGKVRNIEKNLRNNTSNGSI